MQKTFKATNETIRDIVKSEIEKLGIYAVLNHIDVSEVTDMSYMFNFSAFNGDISKWNVSKVTNMEGMFYGTKFTGDLSCWNISKVTNMSSLFKKSIFNGDLSRWDVNSLVRFDEMFSFSLITHGNCTLDLSGFSEEEIKRMFKYYNE